MDRVDPCGDQESPAISTAAGRRHGGYIAGVPGTVRSGGLAGFRGRGCRNELRRILPRKPLTSRAIQLVFKRLGKKINLDRVRLSPHTLRPGFALAYIENAGDRGSLEKGVD